MVRLGPVQVVPSAVQLGDVWYSQVPVLVGDVLSRAGIVYQGYVQCFQYSRSSVR